MPLTIPAIKTRLATAATTTFATTLARIDQMANNKFATEKGLVDIISTDPMLTGSLLGFHHSMGGRTDLGVAEAVRRLGMGGVQQVVRSAMAIPPSHLRAMATIWTQASAVAEMLPLVAARFRGTLGREMPNTETLGMIGRLHNLGHALAMLHFTQEYARACIRSASQTDKPFDDLLRDEIGAGMGEIGALQVELWGLPPIYATVMRWYRRPMEATDGLLPSAALHIAHGLVQMAGFTAAGDKYVAALDDGIISLTGMSVSDVGYLMDRFVPLMDDIEVIEQELLTPV